MANVTRNFTAGKMNKMVDERLVPNGQYIDATNVRMGSTEQSEIGVIENSLGNTQLTNIQFEGENLSSEARCIGVFEDGALETIYWFIHDKAFTSSPTGKLDLIVSYNTNTTIIQYHLESVNDGGGINTTLNFDEKFLITGVNKIENLLFFTDNINPPRKINVQKNYEDPVGTPSVDGFRFDEIMVIKRPPSSAPTVNLVNTGGQENYLDERFLCFGYRYKYDDDEYSATSQFTTPAFIPNNFQFSGDSFLNEGMTNLYNTAEVTFNTGGPLVTGIDLLFKDANSPTIKIIEKLTKADNGYVDNQNVVYSFSSSKIFTILPASEILRLFDNVPRLSQAQTLMGNRLMFGNYVEGYNMTDTNGNPVRFDYDLTGIKTGFDPDSVDGTLASGTYSIQGSEIIGNAIVTFDLNGLDLVEGALITFQFTFEHDSWGGDTPLPTNTNLPPLNITLGWLLTADYSSVYEMASSDEFLAAIGTSLPGGNIEPMANASQGTTLTDQFNSLFVSTITDASLSITKVQSGISSIEQAINVTSSPSSSSISFQFPAIQYQDDPTDPDTKTYTEYFEILSNDLEYQKAGNGSSLHSNRSYEVGILYMDEFNRTTPALVSEFNTFHFACGDSATKNSIDVNIPTTQIAPAFATSYKFAMKPDKENFETIYSNIFFTDPNSNETYFLLESENSQKVTEGQRFIVKADTNGPTTNCVFATVLEKSAQVKDFIEIPSEDDPEENIPVPSGTYMKIKANNFAVETSENAIIDFGCKQTTAKGADNYPLVQYPVNISGTDPNNPSYTYADYTIPGGSRIVFKFTFTRNGYRGGDGNCERREYILEKTLTSSQDYDNFKEWFDGDNAQAVLKQGVTLVGGSGGTIDNEYDNDLLASPGDLPQSLGTNYYAFYRNTTTNELKFCARGTRACESSKWRKNGRSRARICITVFRAENTLIFETEPQDSSPDIWYEGAKTYKIASGNNTCQFVLTVGAGEPADIAFNYTSLDGFPETITVTPDTSVTVEGACGSAVISPATTPTNPANVTIVSTVLTAGTHLGDKQNQIFSTGQRAIASSGFFNCYSFGQGTESYKIRDSLLGLDFKLGSRVTSTQNQDYSETRRFADITYSGIFGDESNINKLNEFNAGLLNFKLLEESFGPIQKLFGRETDILTLQEDKISYVLQGKNLLSDAGAGNLLTTVPEVLGTQIARIEEYGISHNPESFAQYGPDKYFTDAKRGVVLKLSGTSYQNDSLTNISEQGMRPFFRDLFNVQFEKQKLGGFDPYMNEFVLAGNQQLLPIPKECVACGIQQEVTIVSGEPFDECFELGQDVGPVTISWVVGDREGTGPFDVDATYNGQVFSSNNQTQTGSLIVDKNNINISELGLVITSSSSSTFLLTVSCPAAKRITIVEVCVSSANEQGLLIHNEHRFVEGTYVSPLNSTPVAFAQGQGSIVVSFYETTLGSQGQGPIPTTGSDMTLAFRKLQNDTAVFDVATNKFRQLVTTTQYVNTPASVANLLAASTALTTDSSLAPNYYKGSFNMPSVNTGDYLYIIYDYRKPTLIDLCVGADSVSSCCGCGSE